MHALCYFNNNNAYSFNFKCWYLGLALFERCELLTYCQPKLSDIHSIQGQIFHFWGVSGTVRRAENVFFPRYFLAGAESRYFTQINHFCFLMYSLKWLKSAHFCTFGCDTCFSAYKEIFLTKFTYNSFSKSKNLLSRVWK